MSRQMEALLMIAKHPIMERIMMPHIDVKTENVHFNRMIAGRSGGEKSVLAWAWAIWKDEPVPSEKDEDPDFIFHTGEGGSARDPFSGFASMSEELQALCLKAFAYRHGLKIFSQH